MTRSTQSNSTCNSPFDRIEHQLESGAARLATAARAELHQSQDAVDRAEAYALSSGAHVAGAVADTVIATVETAQAVERAAQSSGHLVAAGALAVAGLAAEGVEQARTGLHEVAAGAARGLAATANAAGRLLGERASVRVREEPPRSTSPRSSETLLGGAREQLARSEQAMKGAGRAAAGAALDVLGAAANVGLAAESGLAAEAELAEAGARPLIAGGEELGSAAEVLGAAAVSAAKLGIEGVRALAVLGAQGSAAAADTLGNGDEGRVRVEVDGRACRVRP